MSKKHAAIHDIEEFYDLDNNPNPDFAKRMDRINAILDKLRDDMKEVGVCYAFAGIVTDKIDADKDDSDEEVFGINSVLCSSYNATALQDCMVEVQEYIESLGETASKKLVKKPQRFN